MKTKLFITVLLCLLTIAFVFNNTGTNLNNINASSPPPSVPGDNDFLIGCLHNGSQSFEYITDILGFNLWHKYCGDTIIDGKHYPTGWTGNDKLFENIGNYKTEVHDFLGNIANHNMRTLMQRPKIEYLCYGQRSDYQCEDTQYVNDDYWFYTFQSNKQGHTHTGSSWQDNTSYGNGLWVKRCLTMPTGSADPPGYVVDRLRTNSEQCNRSYGFDAYRWDSECDWYVKPRIRIDSAFANNPANFNTPVCSIKLLNSAGYDFKEVILRVRHFLVDTLGTYNGRYIEEFTYLAQDTAKLIYSGDWATGNDQWGYTARVNKTETQELNDPSTNRADIQVYWYGNCDMWIDYVRVDNDRAHRLLGATPDPDFEQWLLWEADDIASQGGASPYQFYIELFEFNQIPCIAYVNHKIDSIASIHGKHFNVVTDLLCWYQLHLNWDETGKIDSPEQIKRTYYDLTGSKQVYIGDPYPLMGRKQEGLLCSPWTQTQSKIPNTLNTTSGGTILASTDSPGAYDTWLQGIFDNHCSYYQGGGPNWTYALEGVFMYLMKQGDAISKLCNLPFIAMLQAHQWIGGGEVDREPTTEELDLMTNLAVSYGARGIVYWGIGTFNNSECDNSYGIMEDGHPRYVNVYGQPKLEKFQETVGRLKTWGPTLMSFTNADRKSYWHCPKKLDS